MLSFVLLGQGCVFLSIMIKECKGMPVDKVIDSPASPAENTGDRLGATKPVNLVRSEVVQFYSVHNENVDLVLEEDGLIQLSVALVLAVSACCNCIFELVNLENVESDH